jgi:hypothetical protein
VAGNIKAMKNTNDSIGNRYRDLPACSAVPQPTAPLKILKPVQLLNCLCGANNRKEVSTIQLTGGEIKRREDKRSALQHHNDI